MQPELQPRGRGGKITQGGRADPEKAGEERVEEGGLDLLGFAAALPRHFRPLVSWFVGAGSASSFWLGGAALLRPQASGQCWCVLDGAVLLPLLLWINQSI